MSDLRKYWYWADTARFPQIAGLDVRAYFGFIVFLFHARSWTLMLALFLVVVFGAISYFGYTMPVLYRRVRRTLAGRTCSSLPWWWWQRFGPSLYRWR